MSTKQEVLGLSPSGNANKIIYKERKVKAEMRRYYEYPSSSTPGRIRYDMSSKTDILSLYAPIAKLAKAVDCKSMSVGSNPTRCSTWNIIIIGFNQTENFFGVGGAPSGMSRKNCYKLSEGSRSENL